MTILNNLNSFENGKQLLPPTSQRVIRRLTSLVDNLGEPCANSVPVSRFDGEASLLVPTARLALIGTSCQAPLLVPEIRLVAEATGWDILLLRHDADLGESFDICLKQQSEVHTGYRGLVQNHSGIWLMPEKGNGPQFQATNAGLRCIEPGTAISQFRLMESEPLYRNTLVAGSN